MVHKGCKLGQRAHEARERECGTKGSENPEREAESTEEPGKGLSRMNIKQHY